MPPIMPNVDCSYKCVYLWYLYNLVLSFYLINEFGNIYKFLAYGKTYGGSNA